MISGCLPLASDSESELGPARPRTACLVRDRLILQVSSTSFTVQVFLQYLSQAATDARASPVAVDASCARPENPTVPVQGVTVESDSGVARQAALVRDCHGFRDDH